MVQSLLGRFVLVLAVLLWMGGSRATAEDIAATVGARGRGPVVIAPMQMLILPGTSGFLTEAVAHAEAVDAALLLITLDTPGGMLTSTQEMVQKIFAAKVPVVVYVSPRGGSATSAGVFITLAGHVAAMAPGTSIGSAHPVSGDGADVQGDMREKVSQMAAALMKSISQERGRNVAWSEKAVLESKSLAADEAVREKVVDFVAADIDEVLQKVKGLKVKIAGAHEGAEAEWVIPDLSSRARETYQISLRHLGVNLLANPTVLGMLWLAATTGIGAELYHPGLIFPGVVGVICLILALALSQVIPLNVGGVALLVLGGLLFVAELVVPSGVLGFGGVVAAVLGLMWLVDVSHAPDLKVAIAPLLPFLFGILAVVVVVGRAVGRTLRQPLNTGSAMLVGRQGRVVKALEPEGLVEVAGEKWRAVCEDKMATVPIGAEIVVVRQELELTLVVKVGRS